MTPLSFSGTAAAGTPVQYANTPMSMLQSSLTGQTTGYYTGSLETTYTLLTVNSLGNPFNGQGLFLPSYSSSRGAGNGWAYAWSPEGESVSFEGILEQPL